MRRVARASILLFASWHAGIEPVVAAQAQTSPGGWNVDWGERHCSLVRQSEASPAAHFVLLTMPGSRIWQVRLVSREWPADALSRPEQLEMTFQPGAVGIHGTTSVERAEAGQALVRYRLPETMLASFASARSIRLAQGGRPILEVALPGAERALAALRACESSMMQGWGIDAAAQARIPVPPQHANLASLVRFSDYPGEALRRRQTGTVVFRLAVDADGRVSECVVVASSGHPVLDRRTCAIMRERARYEPARDADGNPVAAATVSAITWTIF